jgi:hypothetical protein
LKKKENVKNLIIALVFGIVAFIVLLVINNRISQNEVDMIWAVKEIPQGTTLTEGNIDSYVSAKPTNDSIKNADIIVEKKQLIGMTSLRKISSSELLQKSFFIKGDDIRNNYNNPVLVSFSATDFTGTANGIIRRGDHINVSKLIDKNAITTSNTTAGTGSSSDDSTASTDSSGAITAATENLIVEDAYVVDAFDSSGVKIEPSDTTSIATSFNIYIEKDDETAFYNSVNDKNIAVAKIELSKKDE